MKQKDVGIATFCPVISLWYTGLCSLALSTETLFFTPNNSVLNVAMHEVIPKACLKYMFVETNISSLPFQTITFAAKL